MIHKASCIEFKYTEWSAKNPRLFNREKKDVCFHVFTFPENSNQDKWMIDRSQKKMIGIGGVLDDISIPSLTYSIEKRAKVLD